MNVRYRGELSPKRAHGTLANLDDVAFFDNDGDIVSRDLRRDMTDVLAFGWRGDNGFLRAREVRHPSDAGELADPRISLPSFPAPIAHRALHRHVVDRLTYDCRASTTNCWNTSIGPLLCRRVRLERLLSLCDP
ncbi:MAG: hypothetical protein AB7I42_07375 [Bradyrhizobium sp.]